MSYCSNDCIQVSNADSDTWFKDQKQGWCRENQKDCYFLYFHSDNKMKRQHFLNNAHDPVMHEQFNHYTITNFSINQFVHECEEMNTVFYLDGNGFQKLMHEGIYIIDRNNGIRIL